MAIDKYDPLGHNYLMQTVAELNHYTHRASKLLSELERETVVAMIANQPLAGDLIEGTVGLRKLRFGKGSRGKSGGVRVIYYYHDGNMPILLMTIFAKNEKDNLSQAERNILGQVVSEIKREWRKRLQ